MQGWPLILAGYWFRLPAEPSRHGQQELDAIALELNMRLRKRFDF